MAEHQTIDVPARPSDTRVRRDETIPRWGRNARVALGVLTLISTAVFTLGALAVIVSILVAPDVARTRPDTPLHFVLLFAAIADYLLTLFYIWFASQNPRLASRALWIAGMVLVPWLVQPMYWYAHVLNAPYVGDPSRDLGVPGRAASSPA